MLIYTIARVTVSLELETLRTAYDSFDRAKEVAAELAKFRSEVDHPLRWHERNRRWTAYLPDSYIVITETSIEH